MSQAMKLDPTDVLANTSSHQRDPPTILKKPGMSDAESDKPGSPSAAPRSEGIQQVLEAEASRQRAATGGARAGLPPTLGSRASAFTQRDQILAAVPPGLRPSQSLDLAGSMPPSLRASQSLGGGASIPPRLQSSQSLDYIGPPGLGRATSYDLAAARRAAAFGAYPSTAMMYDPRRRFLLAQQAAAAAAMPSPAFSAGFGSMMGPAWRNMSNDGASSQGLGLLRAASLQLPNRMGATPGAMGASAAAATAAGGMGAAAMTGAGGGAMGLPGQKMPGFSPDGNSANTAASPGKKRKAKDGNDSDEEESSDKVFIPEIRDLDILCGRGGKSNHHFGNKRYRQVVSEMKMMYRNTEAKTVKTDLSRAIVDHVCSYGGRFVKRDEATGKYYLLTKAEARKKTSQALRETKALKWTM